MNDIPQCRTCGVGLAEGATGTRCERCEFLEGLLLPILSTPVLEAPMLKAELPPAENGVEFGDYLLLNEIARGGMGRVHRARQKSLNRVVALKRPLPGVAADPERVRRFRTEAEAVAGLSHPNIVPVFESGEFEGEQYFSMAYIEGQPLSELLHREVVPLKKAATYVRKIAGAVYHAHQRGILHRDLKPANVLIDTTDEPRVTDFGIACLLRGTEAEDGVAPAGTANYMAPEQFAPGATGLSVAADIYALGGILYHLIAGRPPFTGETTKATLWSAYYEEPIAPSALNPAVPPDLEAICLKALQKAPEARYETAQAMAEDLERFEQGRPVAANPVSRFRRCWMWLNRNPLVAALLATLLITAASFMVIQSNSIREIRSARADSEGFIGFMNRELASDLRAVGRLDLMEKINQRAEDYYTNHTALGDGEYLERKALFFENAANVKKELGDLTQAEIQAVSAEAIYKSQQQREPAEARWKRFQSRVRVLRMNIAKDAHLRADAESHGTTAMALAESASKDGPSDPTNRANIAHVLLEQGSFWIEQGRWEGAATNIARAENSLQEVTQGSQADPDWMLMLANCAYYRGLIAQFRQDTEGALQSFTGYLDTVQKLTLRYPRTRRWQFELAVANARVGEAFTALKEFVSAQPYMDVFEDLSRRLTQSDPRNKIWLSLHARSLAWQGVLARTSLNTPRDAAHCLQSALIIQSNLVQDNPDWDRWSEDVAETTKALVQIHARRGNHHVVAGLIEGWRDQCQRLALANPGHAEHQMRLGSAIVLKCRESGRDGGVSRQITQLRESVEQLSTLQPQQGVILAKARALVQMGDALAKSGDMTGAVDAIREALKLRLDYAASVAMPPKLREAISDNILLAVKTHLQADNAGEAVAIAEQGVEWGWRNLAPEQNRSDYAELCLTLIKSGAGESREHHERVVRVLRRTLAERLSEPPTLLPRERDAVEETRQWLSQQP